MPIYLLLLLAGVGGYYALKPSATPSPDERALQDLRDLAGRGDADAIATLKKLGVSVTKGCPTGACGVAGSSKVAAGWGNDNGGPAFYGPGARRAPIDWRRRMMF